MNTMGSYQVANTPISLPLVTTYHFLFAMLHKITYKWEQMKDITYEKFSLTSRSHQPGVHV